jgi:hypothetical protein
MAKGISLAKVGIGDEECCPLMPKDRTLRIEAKGYEDAVDWQGDVDRCSHGSD